jgi:hypothetical protein
MTDHLKAVKLSRIAPLAGWQAITKAAAERDACISLQL